jgi:hypothetical protein
MKNITLPVFETKTYPHARTLRTSFLGKIRDAYSFFVGNETQETLSNVEVGLVDYLLLLSPRFFYYLLNQVKTYENNRLKNICSWLLLFMVLLPIYFLLFGLKHFVAAAFTLVSLPIIASVHLVSKFWGYTSYRDLNKLEGSIEGSKFTLADYMKTNRLSLDELNIEVGVKNDPDVNSGAIHTSSYQLIINNIPGLMKIAAPPLLVKIESEAKLGNTEQIKQIHVVD